MSNRKITFAKQMHSFAFVINFNEEIVGRLQFFGNKKITICLLGAALVVMGNFIVCNS